MAPARLQAPCLADRRGWLDAQQPLPADESLAAALGQARRVRTTMSSAEPWRELVAPRVDQRVQGIAIYAALCRSHGECGSYSSLHRLIRSIKVASPPATIRLHFGAAEAARVDFCSGPGLDDTDGVSVAPARW